MVARLFFVLVLLIRGFAAPLPGAETSPIDSLLELVGDDAALCVGLPNLAGRVERVRDSAFFARIEQSPLWGRWKSSPQAQRLEQLRSALEQLSGRPLPQVLDGLFGQAVVLALYWPEDREPEGVLLLRVTDPELVDDALAVLKRIEPQRRSETLRYAGQTYLRLLRPAAGQRPTETLYLAQLESAVALSDKEGMIRRVLELHTRQEGRSSLTATAATPLGQSSEFRDALGSLSPDAAAWLYVRPRAWDRLWEQASAGKQPPLPMAVWQQWQSLIWGLHVQEGVVTELLVRQQTDHKADAAQPSPVNTSPLDRIPADAVAAVAVNASPARLGRAFLGLVAEKDRPKFESFRRVLRGLLLGADLFDDLLPTFEQWSGYAVLAPDHLPERFPLEGALTLSTSAKPKQSQDPSAAQRGLANALQVAWNLWTASINSHQSERLAVVRSKQSAPGSPHWLEGIPALRPAYLLNDAGLTLATSPSLAVAAAEGRPTHRLTDDPAFLRTRSQWFATEDQLVYFNIRRLHDFLDANADRLVQSFHKSDGDTPQQAERRLREFTEALGLFDAAFVAGDATVNRIRIVAGAVIHPE